MNTRYRKITILTATFLCAGLLGAGRCFGLNLEKIKMSYISQDYKQAIIEGEKLMAQAGRATDLDELYYFLGLSYMKDGNYLRASDIFEIVIKEFRNSRFKDQARLGLGDTYFLRGSFDEAADCYNRLLQSKHDTKLDSQIYYRLSQTGLKKGDTGGAREYLSKIRDTSKNGDIYYSVQVGSFLKSRNATGFANKLNAKGYPAFVEESRNELSQTVYRVKVGKFTSRTDAQSMESRLSDDGYPTKIRP